MPGSSFYDTRPSLSPDCEPDNGDSSKISDHIALVESALSLRNTLTIAHRSTSKKIAAKAIPKYVTGSLMTVSHLDVSSTLRWSPDMIVGDLAVSK